MNKLKARITRAYEINFQHWIDTDSDRRKQHELNIDFTIDCIAGEISSLKNALENTCHLLSVLLADPLVQKDQKAYITSILEANKRVLAVYEIEREAVGA